MAATLFVVFTAVYYVLGADFSFKPDSWEASTGWVVMSIIVGLGAALVGGLLTQRIDTSQTGAWILMGVILILGVVVIATMGPVEPAGVREIANPNNMEAMENAVSPPWVPYLNPLLGCLGVWLATRIAPNT